VVQIISAYNNNIQEHCDKYPKSRLRALVKDAFIKRHGEQDQASVLRHEQKIAVKLLYSDDFTECPAHLVDAV
jgi:hypothetical protein